MFNNSFFVISLSGTVAVVMYFIFRPAMQRFCKPQIRYISLLLIMFFYLMSIPHYKFLILDYIRKIFPIPSNDMPAYYTFSLSDGVVLGEQTVIMPLGTKIIFGCAVVFGIISAVLIVYQLYRMCVFSKGAEFLCEIPAELFARELSLVGIKRNVRFMTLQNINTPYTTGIFRPIIVIPSAWMDKLDTPKTLHFIIHELFHIKKHDVFFKILGLIVIAVHWYNPLCYLFYHELCFMCEVRCDYNTVQKLEKEEIMIYYMLILQFSKDQHHDYDNKFKTALISASYKNQKRRIDEMKYFNNPKKKWVTGIVVSALCAVSTLTAFAYTPPLTIADVECVTGNGTVVITPAGVPSPYEVQLPEIKFDSFITYADGTVVPYTEDTQPKVVCKHSNSQDITHTTHARNGKGGCTVMVYSAKQCSNCKQIFDKVLDNEIKFSVCRH